VRTAFIRKAGVALAGAALVVGPLLGKAPRYDLSVHNAAAAAPALNGLLNPPWDLNPPWGAEVTAIGNSVSDPCWGINPTRYAIEPIDANTQACARIWVRTLDAARATEGIAPLVLPTNWRTLSVDEQLFVLMNLARTSRGLPAAVGLTASLDANAQSAAQAGGDPTDAPSVWAGGRASPFGAMFGWMYDDGWGGSASATSNIACTSPTATGCWGHRDNLLLVNQRIWDEHDSQNGVYAGAGYVATSSGGWTGSYTMSIVPTSATDVSDGYQYDMYQEEVGHSPSNVVFSWAQEVPYLPACEQGQADTCSEELPVWQGSSGLVNEPASGMPTLQEFGGDGAGPTPPATPSGPSPASSCDAPLGSGAVGMAVDPKGGYWIADSDGQVVACGGASFHGDAVGETSGSPVVGIAADPNSGGYWLVSANGGVFSFGDAPSLGSVPGARIDLVAPIVGMAADPSGGYWLVGSNGGVYAFGAPFYGSAGNLVLDQPIVGMASDPSGGGYWLVAADGGVFSFGNAPFLGSVPGVLGELAEHLDKPVVGMAADPSGGGYWLVAADGGVFSFGNAPFQGSVPGVLGELAEHLAAPVVGMGASGNGYWAVGADGGIFSFGVPFEGSAA